MRKATPPLRPVERSFRIVSQPGILKLCFLLRNVSLRAVMSVAFSFRHTSSSLRSDLKRFRILHLYQHLDELVAFN